ncbi:MAG: hypothetical protein HY996_10540 [Micrococcales bacterium]|nr:hypothetical protein [Micrococcales bacterium]
MIRIQLTLFFALAIASQQADPQTQLVRTQAGLAAGFEVAPRFSFVASRLGDGLALSQDGMKLYFTARQRPDGPVQLMSVPAQGGEPSPVAPLCGPTSGIPGGASCEEYDLRLAPVPGDPSRLVVAAGEPGRCCSRVFVLDMARGKARALELGLSDRRGSPELQGRSRAFSSGELLRVSPSGKYVAVELWVSDPLALATPSDGSFAVLSLGTGHRELNYALPVRVVPREEYDPETRSNRIVGVHEEQIGFWDAWWDEADVLVLRQRGGYGERIEKVLAFHRHNSGTWDEIPPPSKEPKKGPWLVAVSQSLKEILVGADARGRGGLLLDGELLFPPMPGRVWRLEFRDKALILKESPLSGSDSLVEVVVLRPRPRVSVK